MAMLNNQRVCHFIGISCNFVSAIPVFCLLPDLGCRLVHIVFTHEDLGGAKKLLEDPQNALF